MSRKDFYSLCVAEDKKQVQCKGTEAATDAAFLSRVQTGGVALPPREQPTPPTAEGGRPGHTCTYAGLLGRSLLSLPFWSVYLALMVCGRNGSERIDLFLMGKHSDILSVQPKSLTEGAKVH